MLVDMKSPFSRIFPDIKIRQVYIIYLKFEWGEETHEI